MRRARPLLLLPVLAVGLQGCVAAVIPLAAAGAMTTTVRDKPGTPEVETRLSEAATPAVPVETGAVAEGTTGESGAVAIAPEVVTPGSVGMWPPLALNTATDERSRATYSAFGAYALELAQRDPLEDEIRPSALLARPGILTPDRAPCRFTGAAVLIDLDPADGLLDPDQPALQAELAAILASLREQDIEVVWSSGLTADRAGDVRNWLAQSSLDPDGEDRVLLLRYPEDRKQTRRNEAAAERCLIAMLGDERADFDELFDYLKDPNAAFALDKMLGDGWFLAPVQPAVETPPAQDEGLTE